LIRSFPRKLIIVMQNNEESREFPEKWRSWLIMAKAATIQSNVA